MKDTNRIQPAAVAMLDNPIWSALTTKHAGIALGAGSVRRYPADVAPFAGLNDSSPESAWQLEELVEQGETIALLSVLPEPSSDWEPLKEFAIHQYIWEGSTSAILSPEVVVLGQEDLDQMLALTALVYPAYFRAGTASLGTYYGIKREDRLVAMAGIRMSMPGLSEISAICTHPDHRGKGLAMLLVQHICARFQERGEMPFLHTEFDNFAGKALYEKTGFTLRTELPFIVQKKIR